MIEAAIILSALNHEWVDFFIILILLLTNASIGFFQEYKADKAISHLKSRLALKARVYRDGSWSIIDAKDLVPGDLIRIKQGDIIPADIMINGEGFLSIDESVLTGESFPVEKKSGNEAYSGSIVKHGEINAIVTNTGSKTYFGKIADISSKSEEKSYFQKSIIKMEDYILSIALILIVIIFISSHYRHEDLKTTLQYLLILVVASIPAALPAVLSITMAVGATNLAKKEAIVKKMTAIEELAGTDILCVDKTGTITDNKIVLEKIVSLNKFKEADVLLYAALCSRREDIDPVDNAIFIKTDSDITYAKLISKYTIKSFTPYDSISKYSKATVVISKKEFLVAKGAPQVILELIKNNSKHEIKKSLVTEVNKYVEEFASKGQRSIGIAVKLDNKWEYCGIIALYDSPRYDSAETLKLAKELGISIKMITGDHQAVSKNVARQVNLGDNIVKASEINLSSNMYVYETLEKVDGVCEVFPENKYTIVKLLQDKDHIVAMTGDGVNDVPALKKANCGIAVADSTDAAKSSADMVLTKPGISVIIDAIKESRNIFQRMKNYATYRIAETIRLMIFITASIVFLNFYPVTPVMIVLLIILNDLPIITMAYDNVVYSENYVRWNIKDILKVSTFLGIIGVISSFLLLYVAYSWWNLDMEVIQTLLFLKLSITGHCMLFGARTRGHFWSVPPAKSLLVATIGTQILATIIAVYGIFVTPIGWKLALIMWTLAITLFVVTDFVKVSFYKKILV